jgi:hypothetical protein
VAKYSKVSYGGTASIFRITELISVDTKIIRREKFVRGVERFVVYEVSLVTCVRKKGSRSSLSSALRYPKEHSFDGTQASPLVLINILTRLIE